MEDAEPVAPPEKIIKRPDSESCTSEGIESPIDGVSPNQPKTIETVSASWLSQNKQTILSLLKYTNNMQQCCFNPAVYFFT